ncbi:DUF4838 domain-containing protein [Chitinophaga sancti]|uniref:DUF4838 domain-containing protein n=1 Tax=Chitinophaga sancti TaxID=1004 RepID=UPI002A74E412|nr:DUF4838 domain-containing protein [Chitinophaga sancti]WPQ62309.1 DUF4838 domain-containing protein [Chitinophaga sancti]
MFRMMHSLLLVLTLFSCQSTVSRIDLKKHVIVLPVEATKNETHAGSVLQDYVKRISGVTLAIIKENSYQKNQAAIFVGNTEHGLSFGKLKGEGFIIASDAKDVYIKGGTGKGVVYGVYTLIEKYFGARKYAEGPADMPASKEVSVPQQLMDKEEPTLVYRETYYPAAFDNEYLEWHKLHRFEDLWGVWGHSFFKIVPPKTYFSAHPEYYALVDGKRQATQLCLSNEGVFKVTVDYLRHAIADNPDALYWSIAAEDGGGFCTCNQCSQVNKEEGSTAGSLIRFINSVAAQFPDQHFTTLAYTYTAKAPIKTKPAANVYIMLSSIDAYRQEPLSTIPSAADFRKNLENWGALTDNLFVWDYTTQFTNYLAPFPDYNNLQPNLQYMTAHKVRGVFSQGSGDTYGDMGAYNAYLQAQLLWDPSVDAAAVTKDFFNGYYGKAGAAMLEYVHALSETKAQLDIYGNPVASARNYLSPEAIDKYSIILDKAEAAVEDPYLKRVYNARLGLEYCVLQQSRFFGTDKYGYLQASGNGYVVNPRWPERVKKFVAQCKVAGVKELSEGGASPDAYQQEWDTIFSKKWVNSLAFGGKVTLVNPPSDEYPAKRERTLTDGLLGTKDFSINWLFIYGKDLVATIDLGGEKTVNTVQMNFLNDPRHYIFNPATITVETSVDGVHFTPAGTQKSAFPAEEDYTTSINTFKFGLAAVHAKYVRVTGQCQAGVPGWRGAPATKKASLCCDEVYVF